MGRRALLIGVSAFGDGLQPLPATLHDLDAMKAVLSDPGRGGFEVEIISDPERQEMELKIFEFFEGLTRDDVALLYFSGHGVKDDSGKLFLAVRNTRLRNGLLVTPTAVSSATMLETMQASRCKRQIVVLDCCFSGAFGDQWLGKGQSVDLKNALGGEGRVILASSSATDYSFEEKRTGTSLYTGFLVDGIRNGAADMDGDGRITADDLHAYVKDRIVEAKPRSSPRIYPWKEGFSLVVSQAPVDSPELVFLRCVEQELALGRLGAKARAQLEERRLELKLTQERAADIIAGTREPRTQRLPLTVFAVVVLCLIFGMAWFLFKFRSSNSGPSFVRPAETDPAGGPALLSPLYQPGTTALARDQMAKGVDVSHHNGRIDWTAVVQSGYSFAVIKATAGTSLRDTRFQENWDKSAEAGLIRGAYHFYEPAQDPTKQVDLFLSTVTLSPGDLPAILDIEQVPNRPSTSTSNLIFGMSQWLAKVEARTGRKPILYTTTSFSAQNFQELSSLSDYPLWVAQYTKQHSPSLPANWPTWTFWQFSDGQLGSGERVAGLRMDLNYFNGTPTDLHRFVGAPK